MNEKEMINKLEELLINIMENQKELYEKYKDLKFMLIATLIGLCLGYVFGVLL